MKKFILASVLACLLVPPAFAQTFTFKNPKGISFVCPDHDLDNEHEVDIVRASDNVVVHTFLIGDPPLTGSLVMADLNVQPFAFGQYYFTVRAIAGTLKSETSNSSSVWQRSPGKPVNVEPR